MSETVSTTLTEFLLARLAEDETYARESGADAMVGQRWKRYPEAAYNELQSATLRYSRRLVAECEAKRRIVEDFETLHRDYREMHEPSTEARRLQARIAMAHLATVYADHPDYDESWRP